jgi:chromosome segregation ATPase
MQNKIQDLSDQVGELQQRNADLLKQAQELTLANGNLETTITRHRAQIQYLVQELALERSRSLSNAFLPSSTIQFDPAEDVFLKIPTSLAGGTAEHLQILSSIDIRG